jgi:GNAT superfamily N-acetyltransferase
MIQVLQQKPTPEQLARLYRDAGWIKDPETLDLQKSIDNTSLWIIAKENDDAYGIARLQTDYVRYCCIYDVIVRSDKRRLGIGSKIMQAVITRAALSTGWRAKRDFAITLTPFHT